MPTSGQIAQKLIDVKVNPVGKFTSIMMWQLFVMRFLPFLVFTKPFWDFIMDRAFSWAYDEFGMYFNTINMKKEVSQETKDYLKAFAVADLASKNPQNYTKEQINAIANELVKRASLAMSLQPK